MPRGIPSRKPATIRRPEQAEALVSPVRQEIVNALSAAGPSTVAQIARLLGRRPDTLYYHVAALERVGLLVRSGRVRAGKRFGVVYDVPARPIRIERGGAVSDEAIARVVRASLRLADRDFRRALKEGAAVTHGPGRNLRGGRVKGWIDEADLPELNDLIARICDILERGEPRPGARLQSFSYVLTPVRQHTNGDASSAAAARPRRRKNHREEPR